MYDFHYNYIKKKYNDKAKLLFTDTDSLTHEIETEEIFGMIRINSLTVNIQKTPHISINQTKKWLERSKLKYQEFQLMSS